MSPKTQGKLVLLLGPSGVGKSAILKELKARHSDLVFPRSATTRACRNREGDDLYQFVTEDQFDVLQDDGKFLETAVVHGEARYGTLADEIVPGIEEGKIVVREVDVQGFDSIRNHRLFRRPDAPYKLESIFILPETKAQLIQHITKRAPMSEEELQRRLVSMEHELDYAEQCDHQITNAEGKLKEAISEVEKVLGY